VQWQVSTNGGTTFTNLSGYTSNNLTFSAPLMANGYQVQAVFTNSQGTATTTPATLTVTSAQDPAGGPAPAGSPAVPALTMSQLTPIVSQAIADWSAAGISASQVAALKSAHVTIADTSNQGALALTAGTNVTIDPTADGYGWFVDSTPADNAEFAIPITAYEMLALGNSPAAGRMDLLTVVEHELGHVLGLPDVPAQVAPDDLMDTTLATGVRRLPSPEDMNALGTGQWTPLPGSVPAVAISIVTPVSSPASPSTTAAVLATSPLPASAPSGTLPPGINQSLVAAVMLLHSSTADDDQLLDEIESLKSTLAFDSFFALLG
jgi:hypothetical protein